jgi:diphthamide synthase subunit DPH2
MKTRKLNIIVATAVLLALTGCGTVPVEQLSEKYERPILSAAEVQAMIRVEVTQLEPIPETQTIVALTSFDGP